MFSIEFSGHLSGLLRPSILFFLSVVLRLNPRIYAVSFGFPNGSSQPVHPFLFLDFLGFFSLFPSENDSRKGTEKIYAGLPMHYGIASAQG